LPSAQSWIGGGELQDAGDEHHHSHREAFDPRSTRYPIRRRGSTSSLLLRNRALALPDDPELITNSANVRLREVSPGVFRMDHDPDQHDDRAVALALAAHELLNNANRGPQFLGAA
jgi:hypothetical protein